MFGDSSFVLMTEAERTGSHYIEIVNPDSADYVRIRLDFQTGRVTLTRQDGSEKSFLLDATALARFISTDPLAEKYPGLSPYNYVANNPIILIDPDGREIYLVIDGQAQKVTRAQLENPDNNSMFYESLRTALKVEDNHIGKYLENGDHDIYFAISGERTGTLANAQVYNAGSSENGFQLNPLKAEKVGGDHARDFSLFDGLSVNPSTDEGKTYSFVLLSEKLYSEEATQESAEKYMWLDGIPDGLATGKYQGAYEFNHEAGAHVDERNNPLYPGNPHPGEGYRFDPNNPWDFFGAKDVSLRARVKALYEQENR
jgi:hypothetical protein